MDTSDKYINMCEKATEIQNLWKPILGDYIASAICTMRNKKSDRSVRVVQYYEATTEFVTSRHFNRTNDEKYRTDIVWLPRQDQLQEIIGESVYMQLVLVKYFSWWSEHRNHTIFKSFEQLWLAFAVYEKYHKIWNNEKGEWIDSR